MPADSAVFLSPVLDPVTTAFTPASVPPPPALVPLARKRAFANKDVFTPSWLPMCASRDLRAGDTKPRTVALGAMKVVLWRGEDGAVHAFESRCPHVGADLGQGRVVDGELRCALHHWRFRGTDGACTHSTASAPVTRCALTFPVVERFGVVFVYPARTPAIAFPELPDGDRAEDFVAVLLPEAKVTCHWHLPTANGLDPLHFEGLHGLASITPWHHDVDEAGAAVHLHLHHRHKSALLQALLGDVQSRFSTFGPSIAWVTAFAPVRMHAFFATRPHADGGCVSRAVIFLPREKPIAALRVLGFVLRLLWQDNLMLNALHDFRPAFVDTDAPLRAHCKLLDRWPRG